MQNKGLLALRAKSQSKQRLAVWVPLPKGQDVTAQTDLPVHALDVVKFKKIDIRLAAKVALMGGKRVVRCMRKGSFLVQRVGESDAQQREPLRTVAQNAAQASVTPRRNRASPGSG